jgi:hypothetical protein
MIKESRTDTGSPAATSSTSDVDFADLEAMLFDVATRIALLRADRLERNDLRVLQSHLNGINQFLDRLPPPDGG